MRDEPDELRESSRTMDELREASRKISELREASRKRDELSARIVHDLRSPLAAVKGAIDLLAGGIAGQLSADQLHYLAIAERATQHVLALVNDLLDASMLDAGVARMSLAPVDLGAILREQAQRHIFVAREKGLALDCNVPSDVPAVTADRQRLAQVLENLLGNAIKFTNPGGQVELMARASDEGGAVVEVIDNGVGIAPATLAQLFDRFNRPLSRGTRGERGTGLGLYICRQLVELQGGRIEVDSRLGVGTTITLRLPGVHAP